MRVAGLSTIIRAPRVPERWPLIRRSTVILAPALVIGGVVVYLLLRQDLHVGRRVDHNETRIEDHEGRITQHDSRLDQAEGQIGEHSQRLDDTQETLAEEEATNRTQSQAIDKLDQQSQVQRDQISQLKKQLSQLEEQLRQGVEKQSELEKSLELLKKARERVIALERRVASDEAELESLQRSVDELLGERRQLDRRLQAIEDRLGIRPTP